MSRCKPLLCLCEHIRNLYPVAENDFDGETARRDRLAQRLMLLPMILHHPIPSIPATAATGRSGAAVAAICRYYRLKCLQRKAVREELTALGP